MKKPLSGLPSMILQKLCYSILGSNVSIERISFTLRIAMVEYRLLRAIVDLPYR